jgi:hypothetical protein
MRKLLAIFFGDRVREDRGVRDEDVVADELAPCRRAFPESFFQPAQIPFRHARLRSRRSG